MIDRPRARRLVEAAFRINPVVALLGPRQCGKTTLARELAARTRATYFDLEHPGDRARMEQPLRVLQRLSGLVIIDEFQHRPGVLEVLRVLVDRPGGKTRFLILGSAAPALVRGASESLAGRLGFVDLAGFTFDEVRSEHLERLWLRGGFPRSFLAGDDAASAAWREGFIRTYLERDIPQLGITIPAETLRRFWSMVAHHHAQIWNVAAFARSLSSSESTARRYLDILTGSYVVRVLPPWFENLSKRQVKSPKVLIRDTGLLHTLLGLETIHELDGHPKLGASWEGFAIEQLLAVLPTRDAYFWATHAGAELDLLVMIRGKRFGFEFKVADAPGTTRSMRVALEDLGLEHLWVVSPAGESYALDSQITACSLAEAAATARTLAEPRASASGRCSKSTRRTGEPW